MKLWKHFCTITRHRQLVRHYCFRLGLYRQGLCHDLSKYSPSEFFPGVHYFQGNRSPNDMERLEKGYSSAWLHHKGRNKHHSEYWIDNSLKPGQKVESIPMPVQYVAEMFCDRIAACQIYLKDRFTWASPYEYFQRSKEHCMIHQETSRLLEDWLLRLKEQGLESTILYIRTNALHHRI